MDRPSPLLLTFLLVGCALSATGRPAAAQSTGPTGPRPATVHGVVTAFSGDIALPGVSVVASDPNGRSLASVMSDGQGRFRIPALPAGSCTLTATLEGFERLVRPLVLIAGQSTEVTLELVLVGVAETVVVKPDVVVSVGASLGSAGIVESAAFLEAPLADVSVQAVLPLLPGVIQGPAGVSIKGGRPAQSGLLIGQVNAIDPSTGDFDLRLPGDAVGTVEVLPNPYAVEFGRFSSGLTAIQTKQGGNRWRLSVSDINPALSTKRDHPLTILGIESFVPRVTVAGPVVGDRVFVAQSLQYRYSSRDIRSRPQDERIRRESLASFTRVDARLGAHHAVTTSVALVPERRKYANLGTFDPPEVSVNTRRRVLAFAVAETTTLANAALLDSRVSISGFDSHTDPQGTAPMEMLPAGNQGNFFNTQERRTRSLQWVESFSKATTGASGQHLFKAGVDLLRSRYEGESASRPILVRRADGTLDSRVTFGEPSTQQVTSTDVAVFTQDRWQPVNRLLVEAGVRVDRDGVVDQTTVSPRLGVRIALDAHDTVTFGGGVGRFVERTPLTIGAFRQFETRTITHYDGATTDGGTTTTFAPRVARDLRAPDALAWNVEVTQRVTPAMHLRAYYLDRSGTHEFLVEQRGSGDDGELLLSSSGRSRYREFALIGHYARQGRVTVDLSYVRSVARADLENHSQLFGSLRTPLVRANEYGPTDSDVPNRIVGQFRYQLGAWRVASVLEWRDGFPYSVVDERQVYVGPRNRGGYFPDVRSVDLSIERRIRVGKSRPYIGLQLFNALGAFMPHDVQRNVAAPSFGAFYNADPRRIRLTLRGL